MAHTPTFGVKFEFLLAYVPCNQPAPYSSEKRCFRFPNTKDGSQELSKCLAHAPANGIPKYTPSQVKYLHREAAMRAIARTLEGSNMLINQQNVSGNKDSLEAQSFWDIRPNATVQPPINSKYSFIGLEITSPAYYYEKEAISHITIFCKLLANTYLVHTNSSCGMHVNVGFGQEGFMFHQLKTLAALFWAYEPQIESLITTIRTNISWAPSMRDNSNLQAHYQLLHEGRRITPAEGILQIMNTNDVSELMNLIGHRDPDRHGNINFSQINAAEDKWRERLEFRGQTATFVLDEVINCIEMWVGIVEYVRYISPLDFYNLLALVRGFETWETLGDGKDDEREKANGPILAEGRFTIIDLLKYMKLYKQALHYCRKYKTNPDRPRRRSFSNRQTRMIVWDHEQPGHTGNEKDKVFETGMKGLWEAFKDIREVSTMSRFDPDSHIWPKHHYEDIKRTPTPPASPSIPQSPALPPPPEIDDGNGESETEVVRGIQDSNSVVPSNDPLRYRIETNSSNQSATPLVNNSPAVFLSPSNDNLMNGVTTALGADVTGVPILNTLSLDLERELADVRSEDIADFRSKLTINNPTNLKLAKEISEILRIDPTDLGSRDIANIPISNPSNLDLAKEFAEGFGNSFAGPLPVLPRLVASPTASELDAESARLDITIALEEAQIEEGDRIRAMEARAAQQEIELATAPEAEKQRLEDSHWRERLAISLGVREIDGSENLFDEEARRLGVLEERSEVESVSPKSKLR